MSLSFIKKNLLIFIIAILAAVVLVSLILISFFSSQTSINEPDRPVGGKSYTRVNDQITQQIQKDDLVGKLIEKLPYQGQNVKLVYTISNNRFTATFKSATKAAGDQELSDFLKQNKIDSTDWLYNYTVESK
jgi:hypothetical protein